MTKLRSSSVATVSASVVLLVLIVAGIGGAGPVRRTVGSLEEARAAEARAARTHGYLEEALSTAADPQPRAPKRPPHVLVVSATRGSDRAPGTLERPLRTLDAAFGRARPGTTIVVRAGTYPATTYEQASGTRAAPIVLQGYGSERPAITGLLTIEGSHVFLRGLDFVGRTQANRDGVLVSINGSDVTIAHSELHEAAMSGVIVGDGSGVRIIGNWIHDNGTHIVNGVPQDHGIYWSGGRNGLIANNVIDHNSGFGIQLYPGAISTLVTSNTILENGWGPAPAAGVILGGAKTSGNTIVNNVVVGNSDAGVRSLAPVGPGNVVSNNLGYANKSGDFPGGSLGSGLVYSGNVSLPPRFEAPYSGDYRPTESSPARGRALEPFSPSTDFAGRPRLGARPPDLGALQAPT